MLEINRLEGYFSHYRQNIIGRHQTFDTPFGNKTILYADWTASGRAYQPIEDCIQQHVLPFVANTHTSTTVTGTLMTRAYEEARSIIKQHVKANDGEFRLINKRPTTDYTSSIFTTDPQATV